MAHGLDVSAYQTQLPWPAFAAAGRQFVIVKVSESDWADHMAATHIAGAKAAGLQVGFYHFLGQTDGVLQARTFDRLAPHDDTLLYGCPRFWVDVEAGLNLAGTLTAFLYAWKSLRPGAAIGIYTGQGAWAAVVGNQHTEFGAYPLWCGSRPLPAGWTRAAIQQNPVAGHLPGYAGDIDLDEIAESVPMPTQSTGVLFGFHTQGNSSAVPIANAYAAAGVKLPIMLSDEDGGKAIDTQATVKVRLTRLQAKETGDDHDFEGGGSGRLGWPEDKVLRYLDAIEYALTVRLGISELNAATLLQLLCNEWEGQDVAEWLRTLDILARVVDKVNEVSARLMTKGLTHPLRLALPAFNAGTPKTWAMYEAIAAHPIWPKLAAQGGCVLFHEGIAFGQPFNWGENQPVEPGAPTVTRAGLVNFRAFNLLWLLGQHGIEIDWAVGEWYDGRKRADDIEARVDNMIRHDRLLAASPWARRCLGYCTYELTNDPESKWWEQDFTAIWQHPRWKAYCVSVKDRVNGETEMPVTISDADWATLTGIVAKYHPAPVWKVGDVAVAVANPLQLYDVSHIPSGLPRPNVAYDINISAVSADGVWVQVSPVLWARTADVKHKGT